MTINIGTELSPSKITADKYTLNYISILAKEAAERYNRLGVDALAKEARRVGDLIFDQLSSTGFYD